jgi:hypothetical protein
MARSCRLALLGLALSTLGVIRARAAEPPPPVRVVYRAPAECPTREEFESRVLARTGRDGLYPEGGAPFELFEIDLTPSPERTRGRLTTHLRGAYPTVREIQAASCREAVDGLALIVALTLDPTASKPTTEPGDATTRASDRTSGSAGDATRSSGRTNEKGRGNDRRIEPGEDAEDDEERDIDGNTDADDGKGDGDRDGDTGIGSSGDSGSALFDVLFAAGAVNGVTPTWMPEGSVSLGAVFPFLADPGLMIRLGGRYAPDQTTVTEQGDATFSTWMVHAAFCPQVFELSILWIAPCANAEYGKVAASGARTLNKASSNRDWIALGPKLIGQLSVLPPLFVHVGGELDFPLLRDRYVLGPLEVHETPVLIGRLELGLGVRL